MTTTSIGRTITGCYFHGMPEVPCGRLLMQTPVF
uniref:Uncharacterized protein n=1 Tax=Rhizophora mucronata TaxID=61149 RepID=A0A2P2PK12_RHIMU